jgi:hypothetical protein
MGLSFPATWKSSRVMTIVGVHWNQFSWSLVTRALLTTLVSSDPMKFELSVCVCPPNSRLDLARSPPPANSND